MAAYRAYAHAQARRYLPVLITGGAQGDYVPAHSGQFADGFPEEPEIRSRLDLLIESLPAGSVLAGIDTEALPSPVRIPENMQRFIDHDPEQVSALLIRRRQAPTRCQAVMSLKKLSCAASSVSARFPRSAWATLISSL